MNLTQYIESINKRYKLGNATEHTYRGDLQNLIEFLVPDIRATNEPTRQKCGAPDYIITRNDIPVGFIEAKDIGNQDLDGKKKNGNKEQFDRYKSSLTNLIFTDYLDFHLYRDGELVSQISIAEIKNNSIIPINENFYQFENLIKDFCTHIDQTISSPEKLAKMMAGKARLLGDIIEKAIVYDIEEEINSDLVAQMTAFKEILIHDITTKGFADVYAQTIAYGLFAARYHDPTLETFSRDEAARLIPKSNPFLRKLFHYIAGPDLDDRILWVVESLVEIFLASDVADILKNFGKATKMEDPIIHFYETFLAEYDPKLRKSRGVWYTPQPVVNFIVRAVDDILKEDFGIAQGLADNSKIKIKLDNQGKKIEEEVHKVQILDPATGTGTFLAEVVKHIHKKFKGQEGIWSNYVEKDLIPRLNGFELLMASYAMAHLKLDLLLSETGYKATKDQRFRIYLTNSLEEHNPDTGTLFASWLSTEANEANQIKRDTPVMCIIGNPPYSGISSNNGQWISELINDYKYIDGKYFNERKHWLNDDYVKFIRYGQHLIEKNREGVLAFINPHGYLDNPTFRGMRWNLLKTFDKIYTIDLHGNSKKKEVSPDGSPDQNVFDIMQGVSINLFVKTGKKKENELGVVKHLDLYGKRDSKYEFLSNNKLNKINFNKLNPQKQFFFFTNKDYSQKENYIKGISISTLFQKYNTGIVTGIDKLSIFDTKENLNKIVPEIINDKNSIIKYNLKDTRRTNINGRIQELKNAYNKGIVEINFRPFDIRYTLPFEKNEYWINSPRTDIMQHFLNGKNVGLVIARQCVGDWRYIFISEFIGDFNLTGTAGRFGSGSYFPLYLYPDQSEQGNILESQERQPNLDKEIVNEISKKLNLTFTNEKEETEGTFAPIDILDYIYAVLHSPAYREKYKEFLKIDFPRVPYPKIETFCELVKIGSEIRKLHLLESEILDDYITTYPISGSNEVEKLKYVDGKVCINSEQYFDGVPEVAWNFYIGGYQPAQKWLKDRKGRELNFDDIMHYQKIIIALSETDKLMKEIDKVGVE